MQFAIFATRVGAIAPALYNIMCAKFWVQCLRGMDASFWY